MKKNNLEKGYTLIELLAVIIVMVIVGTVITGTLVTSLRTSSKSNVIDNVSQNGNNTIVQITKMISYARAFNGISNGDLDAKGGMIFTTDCTQAVSASPGPTPAPATYKYIKITSFDNGTTVFGCNGQNDNPPYTIASNTASLINTSSIAVDYNSCYFTCSQSGYGLPTTIGIYFTLSQLNSNGLAEKSSTIPFEASVTMRNVAY